MTDITNTNLEAALIDQNVAGALPNKRYAFVAVYGDKAWRLGVAVDGENGYNPIAGKTFDQKKEASEWADGLNNHIGLSQNDCAAIICSTMRVRSQRRS